MVLKKLLLVMLLCTAGSLHAATLLATIVVSKLGTQAPGVVSYFGDSTGYGLANCAYGIWYIDMAPTAPGGASLGRALLSQVQLAKALSKPLVRIDYETPVLTPPAGETKPVCFARLVEMD